MDKSSVIASSVAGGDSEDALKVLGRVADAFDNPGSLHKTDKDVLFVVNVVKSRHLLTSLSSEGSVCQSYESSLDTSYDEDVEVVEVGDASRWEHASVYPYASRGQASPRSFSDRIFRQDDGKYDITKMLLTSSPLDRLDGLARMELKKTGWFERTDKWSVVQLGLQSPASRSREHQTMSGRQALRSPTPERNRQHGIKSSTPSPVYSADSSTLSYADALSPRPIRRSRQTRGRLGRVVRDLVRKMLPPSSGGGATWEMTPRSDVSGESRWTGSWHRWSGFWHGLT